MKVIEKDAVTILKKLDLPDEKLGIHYSLNPYIGCEQGCIYCSNRSLGSKYEEELVVYKNAGDILHHELINHYNGEIIGIGTETEIFQNIDEKYNLVENILHTMIVHKAPVHIFTKSNKVLKNIGLIKKLSGNYAAVTFSISTTDEKIAKIFEPKSPSPLKRFEAMNVLNQNKVNSGIIFMPILPYISDKADDLENAVKMAKSFRAKYFIYRPILILDKKQRRYFFKELKTRFPNLVKNYEKLYKNNDLPPEKYVRLVTSQIEFLTKQYGLPSCIPIFKNKKSNSVDQLEMFDDN